MSGICNRCKFEPAALCCECADETPATSALPELPDGFREEGDTLVSLTGWTIARQRSDGFHVSGGHHCRKSAQALAIWLQRRMK